MDNSFGRALKEFVEGSRLVAQGEMKLAKAEAQESFKAIKKVGGAFGTAFGLAFFGALSCLAFAIIGLGRLLGDMYWLSSLIFAALLLGGAAILAAYAASRMHKQNFKMERLRDSLRKEGEVLSKGIRTLSVVGQEEMQDIKGRATHGES